MEWTLYNLWWPIVLDKQIKILLWLHTYFLHIYIKPQFKSINKNNLSILSLKTFRTRKITDHSKGYYESIRQQVVPIEKLLLSVKHSENAIYQRLISDFLKIELFFCNVIYYILVFPVPVFHNSQFCFQSVDNKLHHMLIFLINGINCSPNFRSSNYFICL